MNFELLKRIKAATFSQYHLILPLLLVSNLFVVGYAASDKEAPVIHTEQVILQHGEEFDIGKIQIEDNLTSYEDLSITYDTSTLDTHKVGTSQITVQASDLCNNVTTKIIDVLVIDNEKPVFQLVDTENARMENGVLVINLNSSNVITDYIQAVDNADGDLSAYINQSGTIDTTIQTRQAVALSVTDNSGNTNEKVFDIDIKDITAPKMEYIYAPAVEVPYGETIDLSKYIQVSDNSGKVAVFAPTTPIDSTLPEATYTIVASDEAGNATSLELTLVTKDVAAPTININSRYEVTVGQAFDLTSKLSVVDNKDGAITPTISGSVNTGVAGTYIVTISATDKAGNTATKTVTVVVKQSNSGIVATAKSKVGSAYRYGATGPNAFDCSGFAQWVYRQNGKSIPRTTYEQYAAGTKVSYANMQPGDLIFFNCHNSPCSHVGIYVGGGMIVHAATVQSGVCYTSVSNMV